MYPIEPDPHRLADAIQAEAAAVADLIRSADPALTDAPVPGLSWTAAEVGRHVASALHGFAMTISGDSARDIDLPVRGTHETVGDYLARANEVTLALVPVTDLASVAQAVADGGTALARVARQEGLDVDRECPTPWYCPGTTRSVGTLLALGVTETLVHGWDLAGAFGRRRMISDELAATAAGTVMSQMLPLMANSTQGPRSDLHDGSYEIRLVGEPSFRIEVKDGTVRATGAGPGADCIIRMSPAWSLLVGFGRVPVWRAVVRGQAMAYGRRPWAAARFAALTGAV